jgi:hypothetical protein
MSDDTFMSESAKQNNHDFINPRFHIVFYGDSSNRPALVLILHIVYMSVKDGMWEDNFVTIFLEVLSLGNIFYIL